MSAPNPRRQRAGWAVVDKLITDAENVWVIHYSCESFIDRPDGRSPRITSIAVRRLNSAQTRSFSIHQVAEEQHVPFAEITDHYDMLERRMLDAFYAFVGAHQGMKYLHWNMRDSNFGFPAIEHRFKTLDGHPVEIADERKFDLARIVIDIYGKGYIGHPRLESLINKNHITNLDFLTGAQEAQAFEDRNYVALHKSTLRKVDILHNILHLVGDRQLKTNTTWWEMHGGHMRSFWNLIVENKTLAFFLALAAIALSAIPFLLR